MKKYGRKANKTLIPLLKKYPFFLFLLPLFLVLHIESEFARQINYSFVYTDILKLFLAAGIIFGFSRIFTRNKRKQALIAFCLSVVYYFFCDAKDYLHRQIPAPVFLLYFYSPFHPGPSRTYHHQDQIDIPVAGKIFCLHQSLLTLFIAADLFSLLRPRAASSLSSVPAEKFPLASGFSGNTVKPDIFYLLFDAYTSSKTLDSVLTSDNSRLDSFLAGKGFFEAMQSRSNYNLTPFSITSCFNMQYLDLVDNRKQIFIKNYSPP